jgi:hypothetical protein
MEGLVAAASFTFAGISGPPPDSIDSDKAQLVIFALLALCFVGVFFVIRTVQKVFTRILLLALLALAGGGLWVQRQNLQDCAGQCTCHVFGRDVQVPDPEGGCP